MASCEDSIIELFYIIQSIYYGIQSTNSYDFISSSSLYNSSNNFYPALLFEIFFIIIIKSLLISLINYYQ